MPVRLRAEQQLGVAEDCRQQVVEVVGDPARKPPDGLAGRAKVQDESVDFDQLTGLEDAGDRRHRVDEAAIAAPQRQARPLDCALAPHAAHKGVTVGADVVQDREVRREGLVHRPEAQRASKGRITRRQASVRPAGEDADARTLDQQAAPILWRIRWAGHDGLLGHDDHGDSIAIIGAKSGRQPLALPSASGTRSSHRRTVEVIGQGQLLCTNHCFRNHLQIFVRVAH